MKILHCHRAMTFKGVIIFLYMYIHSSTYRMRVRYRTYVGRTTISPTTDTGRTDVPIRIRKGRVLVPGSVDSVSG